MGVYVHQVGRLARDPESTTYGNDTKRTRTTFRVLTTDIFGSGESRREVTEGTWYTVWGPPAIAADEILRQGDLVEILAEKRSRQYKDPADKSGELKWTTEFIVTRWKRLAKASGKSAAGGGAAAAAPAAGDDQWMYGVSHGDDLPPLDMDMPEYPAFDESAPN